LRHSVVN